MDEMKLFVPITKVDAANRLVYGTIAHEVADKSGEIMDYASAKPQFESWSADIGKATGGNSVGNIRAMHGSVAAGKLTSIAFDDAEKRIEACGKIIDDGEWNKVLEGVYTGFSMGGKYLKRWKDPDEPHLTRYTPSVSEVSIVDNPCIPTATFEVVKADGSTELRKFKSAEPAPAVAATPTDADGVRQRWLAKDGSEHKLKADALAKNAEIDAQASAQAAAEPANAALARLDAALANKADKGDGKKPHGNVEYADPGLQPDKKKRYPVDTEAHIRAAWNYISKPKNAGKYSAEDAKKIKAKIVAAWKDKIDKDGPPSAADKAAMAINLAKGLWTVCRASDLIDQLTWIRDSVLTEEQFEGDGSPAGKLLGESINTLLDWLAAYVQEEVNEAKTGDDTDVDYEGDEYQVLEMAAVAMGLEKAAALGKVLGENSALGRALIKAGARHSKTDQARVQKAHDMAKDMHDNAVGLGADCDCAPGGDKGETPADGDEAAKLAKIAAERDAMQKAMVEIAPKIDAAVAKIEEQAARIAALEAQPMPGGPVVNGARTVTKGQESGGSDDAMSALTKHLATLTPDQRALALMKMTLAQPMEAAPQPVGRRA